MAFSSRSSDNAPMAEINITPFVDVMLVLLVIFLVTAPLLTQVIPLDLPQDAAEAMDEPAAIDISLNKAGQVFWKGEKVDMDELAARMRAVAKHEKQAMLNLRADEEVAYGKVSHILAMAQKSGIVHIGFVTQPQ